MTLNINLIERDGDEVTVVPLHNVVFEGGEPAFGNLVRCEIDGEEVVGSVISVEHEPQDPPGTSTVTLERVDERLLTQDVGISFLGEPGHMRPATSTLDFSEPSYMRQDKRRVY